MEMVVRVLAADLLVAAVLVAQWHVAPNGNDAGAGTALDPFRTIAHAAAVTAPGGTLYLHAGSYGDEQGIVALGSKDLALQGDGTATTVLRAHSSQTVLLDIALAGPPVLEPHRVGLVVDGPARVHVRDLTIDAGQQVPASGRVNGVRIQGGADCLFDRVEITGCRPAVLQPTSTATAMVVYGDLPTDPTTTVLRACRLVAFAAAGLCAQLRSDIDMQECDVVGAGAEAGAPDQVGALLQAGAIGRLRHSRIAALAGAAGTAIRLDGQGASCAVEGNRIGECIFGIDVLQAPPAVVPGSIRANRIAGAATALRVRGNSGLTIAGNSLFPASSRDPLPVSDDTAAGNAWHGNRYANVPPGGPMLIPGGINVDNSPLSGCSELGRIERVPLAGAAPIAVQVADFDGNGKLDFATLDLASPPTVTVARAGVTGFTLATLPFGSPDLRPVALVVGEFDGLPGKDLVVLTAPRPPATAGAGFFVLANNGTGGMSILHFEPLPGFVAPSAIAAASFNANAVDDLVVGDRGAWPLVPGAARTLLNDGSGMLWFSSQVPASIVDPVTAVAVGDIDGDHKIDIAVCEGTPTTGRVHMFAGTGIGTFVVAAASPISTPANPLGVVIADFDRDGDADVVVSAADGVLPLQRGVLLLLEHVGSSFVQRTLPTDLGPARIVSTDIDADTTPLHVRPELLVLDLAAGNLALFGAHEPGTGFVGGGLCTGLDGPADIGVGSFDGDEFVDAIAAEPARGGVAILHGVPTARVDTFGRGCPGTAGLVPRLETRGAPASPVQPNLSLQLGIADAPPFTLVVIVMSPFPAANLPPCGFLLSGVFATYIAVTDVQGRAVLNLPVPPLPDVRGLPLCMQAGTFDPTATTSFFPGFGLSALLRVRVGD